uniref:Uncharacterized protein n=1 Tax=Parascaris univalens TaxID=6257 RepID=A0A915ARW7_PARUN
MSYRSTRSLLEEMHHFQDGSPSGWIGFRMHHFQICRVFDPENLYSFFDKDRHYNDYAMKCFQKVYSEIVQENYANGIIG